MPFNQGARSRVKQKRRRPTGRLSDCPVGVILQRLHFRPELNLRIPECEILMATHAVRNFIRSREFYKIPSALEIGAEHGMWTFQRVPSARVRDWRWRGWAG